ncbi:hypothetical protein H6G95_36340 [Nostoc linckia FACHB-391]|uniref:Uncharacterized protein n=1 Tax=Nostoc linckia FACHB-391 TaxID=2692906 RepID=A0ABR8FAM5_NOSLI|nr:hypothetical protein [Nostoc linckia]MBD2565930.1 hypothetical protein [Nostoc linckia FACHB-391]
MTSHGAVWLEPSGAVPGDLWRGDQSGGGGVGRRPHPQCRLHTPLHRRDRGAVWLEPSGAVPGDLWRGDQSGGGGVGRRPHPQCRLHTPLHRRDRGAVWLEPSGAVPGDLWRGDQSGGGGVGRRPRSQPHPHPQCRLHTLPHRPGLGAVRLQASGGFHGDAGCGYLARGAVLPPLRHHPRNCFST